MEQYIFNMKHFLICTLLFSLHLFSQQTKKVDFTTCHAIIKPIPEDKSISGRVTYEFKLLKDSDTIKIDAINMDFKDVYLNDKRVNFKNSGKALLLFEGYKKGKNSVSFEYSAKPKQTLYFSGEGEDLQIWTQGQGKYTSHWLPSFDDVNEKVIFNIAIDFNSNYAIYSNGVGINIDRNIHYSMQKPMSSYLVMIAIGKFEKMYESTNSGTILEFVLDRRDIDKFEPTYRYSKQMFEFLEDEIGVKYPWVIYKQIPVRDFLYAGMENTTSTIFSQDFVVDSIGFNDKNYVNVNAHELAHQWFGDLITAKESKHHWLHEGFATYYALLAEKEVFGDDYFYNQLYESAQLLQQASEYDTIPILNEKASSLTFYKKGAWALHVLRTDIGEDNFRKAVKRYLKKYAYKNVDTNDFLKEIKKVSKYNVAQFKEDWLENPKFNFKDALRYLIKNNSVKELIRFNENNNLNQDKLFERFKTILESDVYYTVKREVIYQSQNVSVEEQLDLLRLGLQTNDIKIRQAVAEVLNRIPIEFKPEFETLLQDKSYITREIALFRLWTNFKDDREKLIEMSKNWIGVNYNLKIANLTLQIVGSNDNLDRRQNAITELEEYTKLPFEASVREAALQTFVELGIITDTVIEELINASLHHKWQFVKFGKDNIRKLISSEEIRKQFINIETKLAKNQSDRIKYFLKETE